jgi:hypothetical protein
MASTDAPVRRRTPWNQGPTFRRATTGLIVTTDGFEDSEFSYPFYRLRVAGFIVDMATPDGEPVTGTHVYEFDAAAIDAHDPDWWATATTCLSSPAAFDLGDTDAIVAWLSDFFGRPVDLRRERRGGFPRDTHAAGPTVDARATLEGVAGWFDGIDAGEMERRLRPNLVVSGVEPFGEDRLYGDRDTAVAFRVGDCEYLGSNPCQRCVVPTRDPDTGEPTPGFRERFVAKRRQTLPQWAAPAWFDYHFRLMVNTFVPEDTVGETLRLGDDVEILGERSRPA